MPQFYLKVNINRIKYKNFIILIAIMKFNLDLKCKSKYTKYTKRRKEIRE